jgi:hypothetical protein
MKKKPQIRLGSSSFTSWKPATKILNLHPYLKWLTGDAMAMSDFPVPRLSYSTVPQRKFPVVLWLVLSLGAIFFSLLSHVF